MKLIEVFSDDISQKTFGEVLSDPSFKALAILFQKYLDSLRINGCDLAANWMTYIDVVQIMLNLLRASKEEDWSLHLSAIHDLIPWCFSYDRHNYARYLSCYYSEMTHLEQEHSEIHAYLREDGFSLQIGAHNQFGWIPVDQTMEETINKDTQTPGGMKGFSLMPNAIGRY